MSSENVQKLQSPIGLIAGNGTLPLEILNKARETGLEVVTIAHLGETRKEVEELSAKCRWIKVGQLGKLIRTLKASGVRQAVFAGGINKPRLFSVLSLDLKGLMTIARMKTLNDDNLLRGVAREIESAGIDIFSATLLLDKSLARQGVLTNRPLTKEEKLNAEIGWKAAEDLGRHDIGQSVMVNRKAVVAVEAIEGTDACIERAAALSGKGCVLVKLSKPGQDDRFDLPAIGVSTVTNLEKAGATALVLRDGGAILISPQEILEAANRAGIAIEVWDSPHSQLHTR